MVTFKDIQIENYYSIGNIHYNFVNGLHKLAGVNGQGKTSLCSSIAQCLYNRSIKSTGETIDSTYNKVTGLPYRITLNFSTKDAEYTVCNDRSKNNIFITRNGKDVTPKGIKNQLTMIQGIIGLDYDTFISLTYLSQSSMNTVFDLSDTNNILHKFFDVDMLEFLTKELKAEKRDLGKQVGFMESQLSDLEKTISSLEQYALADTTPLVTEKYVKMEELNQLLNEDSTKELKVAKNTLAIKLEEYEEIKAPLLECTTKYKLLKEQLEDLESGTCPLCGSEVTKVLEDTKSKVDILDKELRELKTKQVEMLEALSKHKDVVVTLELAYTNKKTELEKSILALTNKIALMEERNTTYKRISSDLELLKLKKDNTEKQLVSLRDKVVFVTSALQVITSGSITKQYVRSFIHTFNTKIGELISYLDIKMSVQVKEVDGSIVYVITNATGAEIAFPNLSSGERTRVSLIVLLAIVDTLEALTNVSLNLIIFDELLSVLDTAGVEVLKDILNKYRRNKNTFVVLHHNEIEKAYFDSTVVLSKEQNLTKILRVE